MNMRNYTEERYIHRTHAQEHIHIIIHTYIHCSYYNNKTDGVIVVFEFTTA